jgi:hypothetical protein
MAEYGEWNRKGASLSDVTAQKEYGVTRDFIVEGIRAALVHLWTKGEFPPGPRPLCANPLATDGFRAS